MRRQTGGPAADGVQTVFITRTSRVLQGAGCGRGVGDSRVGFCVGNAAALAGLANTAVIAAMVSAVRVRCKFVIGVAPKCGG